MFKAGWFKACLLVGLFLFQSALAGWEKPSSSDNAGLEAVPGLAPNATRFVALTPSSESPAQNEATGSGMFEANVGQHDPVVRFFSRGPEHGLFLTPTEAVMVLPGKLATPPLDPRADPPSGISRRGAPTDSPDAEASPDAVVRMRFDGADAAPSIRGVGEVHHKTNYFIGDDPSKWRTNVPNFERVLYEELYPGIDLDFYTSSEGELEYDFIVGSEGDPRSIRLAFEGADAVAIDASGDLILNTAAGDLRHRAPVIYQESGNVRLPVEGRYVLLTPDTIGFHVGSFDTNSTLVIDPVIKYSTYHGGSWDDQGSGMAIDSGGNTYVTGWAQSTDFPTRNAIKPTSDCCDAFVSKFSPSGTLVYSTYLGAPSGTESVGKGIAVDSSGNAYVGGETCARDFPTLNAVQTTNRGRPGWCMETFAAKLTPSGALSYSTYLGGSYSDYSGGLDADANGNAYISGSTCSYDFPTHNAMQPVSNIPPWDNTPCDAFVTKLTPSGAFAYSTFLGGLHQDEGTGVSADAAGNAYVTGVTCSTDFPTLNAEQASNAGCWDTFVTKLTSGGALSYSTYLGGSFDDMGEGIAADPSGNAHITGWTCSDDFPTKNAIQPTIVSCTMGFVTRFTASGELSYSTYLGGSPGYSYTWGYGITTDSDGNAYATGETCATEFPIFEASQPTMTGCPDAYVTKFTPSGSLAYSTFLGGSDHDSGRGIAVDAGGNAHVTGQTCSEDFPLHNARQRTLAGCLDAFVTVLFPSSPTLEEFLVESIRGTTPFGGVRAKQPFACHDKVEDRGTVNLASGEFVASFCVLGAPVAVGPPLSFRFTYRLRPAPGSDQSTDQSFRIGQWTLSYGARLEELPTGDILRFSWNGRVDTYVFDPQTATYLSPPGFYDILTQAGDGTFVIRDRHGGRELYASDGRLLRIEDASQNAITLSYGDGDQLAEVTDAHGRASELLYDETGQISEIRDFAGRRTTLSYNDIGQLTSVTTPGPAPGEPGMTTRFAYAPGNDFSSSLESLLRAITDAKGQTYLVNFYDGQGRVTAQDEGGDLFQFQYDGSPRQTTTLDRNGNLVRWTFQADAPLPMLQEAFTNREVDSDEPDVYVTVYEHNANLELTRIMYPAGNGVESIYDIENPDPVGRGNLLEIRKLPRLVESPQPPVVTPSTGTQAAIVTRHTYDTLFNRVKTTVSPRGNDPTFIPPNGGANSPERYTTTYFFDHEEATLGDLNGDGITNQAHGNVVMIVHPPANPSGVPHSAFTPQYSHQERIETYAYNELGQKIRHVDAEGIQTLWQYYPSNGIPGDPSDTEGFLFRVTTDEGAGIDPHTNAPRLNIQQEYTYDAVGNNATTKDGRGSITTFTFDARNRLVNKMTSTPFSYTTRFSYDANDNLVRQEHANVVPDPYSGANTQVPEKPWFVTEYSYDVLDRRIETREDAARPADAPPSSQPETIVARVAFDPNGNVASIRRPDGDFLASYAYDERNLMRARTLGGTASDALVLYLHVGDANGPPMMNTTPPDREAPAVQPATPATGATWSWQPTQGFQLPATTAQVVFWTPSEGPAAVGGTSWSVRLYSDDVLITENDPAKDPVVTSATQGAYSELRVNVLVPATSGTKLTLRLEARQAGTNGAGSIVLDGREFPSRLDIAGTSTAAASASTTSRHYDANGKLVREVDAMGSVTTHEYDGFDRQVASTDALGNRHEWAYDPEDNIVRERRFGPTTGQGPRASLDPTSSSQNVLLWEVVNNSDEANRIYRTDKSFYDPTSVSSGSLNLSELLNDSLEPLQAPPPFGGFSGSSVGTPSSDGQATTLYEHDRLGRIIREIDDNGRVHTQRYDGAGRMVQRVDPGGNTQDFAYDANGNIVRTKERELSPDGFVPAQEFTTLHVYDSLNRRVRTTDPLGHTLRYAYDSRGNVVFESDAQGAAAADPLGLFPGSINEHGNVIRRTYDGLGRLLLTSRELRVGGAGNGTLLDFINTTQEWDTDGRLVKQVDDAGKATRSTYDRLGRKTSEIYADGTSLRFSYDRAGNPVEIRDANGNVIRHTFDALHRLIGRDVTPGPGVVGTTAQRFEYDGLSRLTLAADMNSPADPSDDSVITIRHDSLDHPVEETQNGRKIERAFDGEGNQLSLAYPSGRVILATPDALNRVDELRHSNGSLIADYSYIGPKRVVERTLANGVKTAYGYDAARWITSISHNNDDGDLVAGFNYGYDRAGNRVSERKLHAATESEIYDYDSTYRLVAFERGTLDAEGDDIVGAPRLALQSQTWVLDGVHNWNQTTSVRSGVVTSETREHGPTNELSAIHADGGTITLVYDANGNLLQDAHHTYRWDFKNRLRSVAQRSTTATIAEYVYDALDRRIGKTVTNSSGLDGTTTYTLDGTNVIEERDDAGAVEHEYVHGLANDLLARLTSDDTLYYHADTSGSIHALTGASGTPQEGYAYDPYGIQTVIEPGANGIIDWGGDDTLSPRGVSSFDNAYGFTGQRMDPETGLYHYRARQYDPAAGRFLSRDPLGVWGDPGSFGNAYAYAASNPISIIDPTGKAGSDTKGEPYLTPEEHTRAAQYGEGVKQGWHGMVRYGNYCGPGEKPGKPKPEDALDACCKQHDRCYENCKFPIGGPIQMALPDPKARDCDRTLYTCAKNVDCSTQPSKNLRKECAFFRVAVMTVFGANSFLEPVNLMPLEKVTDSVHAYEGAARW